MVILTDASGRPLFHTPEAPRRADYATDIEYFMAYYEWRDAPVRESYRAFTAAFQAAMACPATCMRSCCSDGPPRALAYRGAGGREDT